MAEDSLQHLLAHRTAAVERTEVDQAIDLAPVGFHFRRADFRPLRLDKSVVARRDPVVLQDKRLDLAVSGEVGGTKYLASVTPQG